MSASLPKVPHDKQVASWQEPLLLPGYVRRGYIEERTGLNPAIRFVYDPMLMEDVQAFQDRLAEAQSESAAVVMVAALLAERLFSWSCKEKLDSVHIRMLPKAVLQRIKAIVEGSVATDIDPLWPKSSDAESHITHPHEIVGKSQELSSSASATPR